MGLLHDLTHAPYGHTLEDEIRLITTKHDFPDRQADAFYRLLCQYLGWITRDSFVVRRRGADADTSHTGTGSDPLDRYLADVVHEEPPLVRELVDVGTVVCGRMDRMAGFPTGSQILDLLGDLYLAMTALLHLELLHKGSEDLRQDHIPLRKYRFQELIELMFEAAGRTVDQFDHHEDAFLLDVIGNTVCADLLDYVKRDAFFCGLKLDYDEDRIVENFTLVSVTFGERPLPQRQDCRYTVDPFSGHVLRPAVSIFTHKFRIDVPGQLMGLLQARFHLYERALYHPTKCIAGAMLGSALQLFGWNRDFPTYLRHVGDCVFLEQVHESARLVLESLRRAARNASPAGVVTKEQLVRALPTACSAAAVRTARSLIDCRFALKPEADATESVRDLEAGKTILDRLFARRYYKPVFRLLPTTSFKGVKYVREKDEGHPPAEIVAPIFLNAGKRFRVERDIEAAAGLPRGSVVIHCPPYGGPSKVAEVLLLALDGEGNEVVKQLSEIGQLENGIFTEHQAAVKALHNMYQSTWRLVVSVSPDRCADYTRLEQTISNVLTSYLVNTEAVFYPGLQVPNDPNMTRELVVGIGHADKRELEKTAELPVYAPEERGQDMPMVVEIASDPVFSTHQSSGEDEPLRVHEVMDCLRSFRLMEAEALQAAMVPGFVDTVNRAGSAITQNVRRRLREATLRGEAAEKWRNQINEEEAEAKLYGILSDAKESLREDRGGSHR